jgi:hypothetical protein
MLDFGDLICRKEAAEKSKAETAEKAKKKHSRKGQQQDHRREVLPCQVINLDTGKKWGSVSVTLSRRELWVVF